MSVLSGGLAGAGTGYQIGGIPGAVAGGVLGGFGGLFSKKKKKKKISTLDKKQQKINEENYNALFGQGEFADLYNYNPEMANKVFDETIANPAYRKFKEDLAPGITGQFRSQGLQNSSYAGDALSKMARDIQENLNAQRSQYLYGKEQAAQSAKQQGIENFQNRQTFAYDKNSGGGGFNIDAVLNSITPEMIDKAKNYFGYGKKATTGEG